MSGPLPDFLLPVTAPLAWGYERIIRARNSRFDRGIGIARLDVPVISVGNITTGGVGKTPMVAWIARQLLDQARHPAIAMRGYGATGEAPADEALEYEDRLPQVPVIADPDRFNAVRTFLAQQEGIGCIILDDGFQHRRVYRDLDLVLIDATQGTFTDRMLPAGNLREPIDVLKRADAVIVTRAECVNQTLASQIEFYHHKRPVAWSRHKWTKLIVREAQQVEPREQSVDWLNAKRVVTMLGVGNPKAVMQQIEESGATIAANVPARDHERYTPQQLTVARGLCAGADALVVTGKDWVKLRDMKGIDVWPVPIVVPVVEIEMFAGADALNELVLRATAQ
jgi:tetraacyldisaccharide 4'-kinase